MDVENVCIYFKITERLSDGTDDEDNQQYTYRTMFDYKFMALHKVLDFMEEKQTDYGEEGGNFEVVAIVRKDKSLIAFADLEKTIEDALIYSYQEILEQIQVIKEHIRKNGNSFMTTADLKYLHKRLFSMHIKMKKLGIKFIGGACSDE